MLVRVHALGAAVAVTLAVVAAPPQVSVEKNVPVRMRDGVTLRADVYRPDGATDLPALLERTPYSKNLSGEVAFFRRLAAHGYVVVAQDTRGRYMSDGIARPHDELALALVVIADAACSRESVRAAGATRLGYSRDAFERQRTLERGLRDAVSADEIRKGHAVLTHQPHMSGTDGARVVADYLARTLKGAGLDVEVLEYQAYLSFPKTIEVSIVAPIAQTVSVNEPPSPLDPDTQNRTLGPAFVAYSGSGDVTAPAVYVNYGLPPDYAQLANQNVDVRGKVVIARYGKSHRAVKLHTAEKAGAAGILIYSDPADDGFVRGKTWPDGYWRTADQMQRGNGKYSWFWHGDPLTPGVAAVRDAVRQDPAAAPTLPRIPAAVLSWGEARKILERLDGPPAPAQFRGGMPIEYHLGGGRTRVRVRVEMDNGLRTIRDVVAHVPGARQADREVILGTHHDAWTYGGVDPGTGTAVLLELGRVLGALGRGGWRPQRTITLAFWDAEEFGLIGSTEYAEDRKDALRERAVAYINTDLRDRADRCGAGPDGRGARQRNAASASALIDVHSFCRSLNRSYALAPTF